MPITAVHGSDGRNLLPDVAHNAILAEQLDGGSDPVERQGGREVHCQHPGVRVRGTNYEPLELAVLVYVHCVPRHAGHFGWRLDAWPRQRASSVNRPARAPRTAW